MGNRLLWCHCGWDIGAAPQSRRSGTETPDSESVLPPGASALRLACRQTYVAELPSQAPTHPYPSYTETIPILYSHNEFSFNEQPTLLSFATQLLPPRLHAIRSLRLQWSEGSCHGRWCPPGAAALRDEATWTKTWQLIATMRGLRALRVTIALFPPCAQLTALQVRRVLQPLRAVTRPEVFEVYWQWEDRLAEAAAGLGDVPFVFVDPNGGSFGMGERRRDGWLAAGPGG
ncbi:hypothetical protein MMC17_000848 [Xylographa soralifera]|nr:hypothetical protein [Xylographa soralifera]